MVVKSFVIARVSFVNISGILLFCKICQILKQTECFIDNRLLSSLGYWLYRKTISGLYMRKWQYDVMRIFILKIVADHASPDRKIKFDDFMDKVERGNIGGYTKYEADVFIEAWYGACFKYPNHFCQHETKEMKWQHLFYFCTRRENGVLPIAARISHDEEP